MEKCVTAERDLPHGYTLNPTTMRITSSALYQRFWGTNLSVVPLYRISIPLVYLVSFADSPIPG